MAAILTASVAAAQGPGAPVLRPPRDGAGVSNAPAPQGNAAIQGSVAVGTGGRPARGARVNVVGGEPRIARTFDTDPSGHFAITGLRPGRYIVTASKPGFVTAVYGSTRPGDHAPAEITLAAGAVLEANLTLYPGGVLSGRVVDSFGEPTARVSVKALRIDTSKGLRRLLPVGLAQTDDRGIYRLYGLDPGEYLVTAIPTNDIAAGVAEKPASLPAGRDEANAYFAGYAPVYFPAGLRPDTAIPVRVNAGDERDNIDLQLELTRLGYVDGYLVGLPQGATAHVALVSPALRGLAPATVQAGVDGSFRIAGMPPGNYTLVADVAPAPNTVMGVAAGGRQTGQSGERYWATLDIAVGEIPIRGVALVLQAGSTLSGRVAYDVSRPSGFPLDLTRSVVRLVPVDLASDGFAGQVSALADASGNFKLKGITPGTYHLMANSEGPYKVRSAIVAGQETLDFPITIEAGRDVSGAVVTFSDRVTDVGGVVLDERGKPQVGASVLLFPLEREYRTAGSRRIVVTRVATDGRFTFHDVAPGQYRVTTEIADDVDLTAMEELFAHVDGTGQAVSVTDGQRTTVTLHASSKTPGN